MREEGASGGRIATPVCAQARNDGEGDGCEGCGYLVYEEPVNRYDVYTAHCCDKDKPMMGARRVVAVSRVGRPVRTERPKWCRRT